MSDAPLTDCPQCGTAASFKKQLTAAGFQLKGSGWYVTDFRGGNNGAPAVPAGESGAATAGDKSADSSTAAGAPTAAPAPAANTGTTVAAAPAPAPAPASAKDSS
jgi:predicted nucleic acid-binding Zn ribbon protein